MLTSFPVVTLMALAFGELFVHSPVHHHAPWLAFLVPVQTAAAGLTAGRQTFSGAAGFNKTLSLDA